MAIPVVGLGAGGHAQVIVEMLQQDAAYEIVGLLDANPARWGARVLGVPVLGGDEELAEPGLAHVRHFFNGVGSVGDTSRRRAVYERAVALQKMPVTVVHPRAVVSRAATLGAGTVVMAGAIVNPGTVVGENVIVNTGAIIDHDCRVGDHAHIATGACLSGGVQVGASAHIGAGATVRQSVRIGAEAVVGAGAAVIDDVAPQTVVVGVPARVMTPRPKAG